MQKRSERLHQLAVWLAATCETIEAENDDAASLRVHLAVIVVECERIAGADVAAPETECDGCDTEEAEVDSAA